MINLEAARWLKQAREDLETAEVLFNSQRYGPCAFFCQQAAEKALKAIIYNVGEKPWGHSVPSLLDQACALLQIERDYAPLAEAEALDEHYLRPRYPDVHPEALASYDQSVAEEALQQARIVLAFVEEHLKDAGDHYQS